MVNNRRYDQVAQMLAAAISRWPVPTAKDHFEEWVGEQIERAKMVVSLLEDHLDFPCEYCGNNVSCPVCEAAVASGEGYEIPGDTEGE